MTAYRLDPAEEEHNYTIHDIFHPSAKLLHSFPPSFICAVREEVSALLHKSQYEVAAEILQRLLVAQKEAYGTESDEVLRTTYQLAVIRQKQCQHKKAEELLVALAATSTLLLGSAHPSTLNTVDALVHTYRALRKLNEAEILLTKHVRLLVAQGCPDSALVTRNNLGLLYVQQKRPAEARKCFETVLADSEGVRRADDPDILSVIGNLAYVYRDLGLWMEAEALYKKALVTAVKTCGGEHPGTIAMMASSAASYAEMGRWHDVRVLAEKVLTTRQRQLGTNHIETLKSQYNLGNIYLGEGNFPDALACGHSLMVALDLCLPYGNGASTALPTITGLKKWECFLWQHFYAVCLINNERFDEAGALQSKLIGTFESEEDNEYYSHCFSQSLYDLGRIRRHQLRLEEAESYFRQALAVTEATENVDSKNYSTRIEALTSLLRSQNRCSEVRKLLQNSVSRAEALHGSKSLSTATWLLELGGFFKDHNRWSQARDIFLRALHIREEILGLEHVEISIPCAEVGHCLECLGDDSQAAKYWSRALRSRGRDTGLDNQVTTAWMNRLQNLLTRLQAKVDGDLLVSRKEFELAVSNTSEGDEDDDDDMTLIEELEYPRKLQGGSAPLLYPGALLIHSDVTSIHCLMKLHNCRRLSEEIRPVVVRNR
ncbi:MAG: hypothetical protein Q9182_004783 [Xanthomendoza sp. 2 TL-2023]